MGFFGIILMIIIVWLLWNISRNTADTLDKQTALQYEIVALERRIDEYAEKIIGDQPTLNKVDDTTEK